MQNSYKTQTEGVITIKDDNNKLIAIIYKDGPTPPVVFLTETAGVEDLVELMGCTLTNNPSKL